MYARKRQGPMTEPSCGRLYQRLYADKICLYSWHDNYDTVGMIINSIEFRCYTLNFGMHVFPICFNANTAKSHPGVILDNYLSYAPPSTTKSSHNGFPSPQPKRIDIRPLTAKKLQLDIRIHIEYNNNEKYKQIKSNLTQHMLAVIYTDSASAK